MFNLGFGLTSFLPSPGAGVPMLVKHNHQDKKAAVDEIVEASVCQVLVMLSTLDLKAGEFACSTDGYTCVHKHVTAYSADMRLQKHIE